MISLNCTNCQTLLEIDDAFAGGVCRCRHCGAIQTVPSHLKQAAGATGAGKTLYTGAATPSKSGSTGAPGRGTGLDELAEIVASSGLSRHSLRRPANTAAPADDVRSGRKTTPLLVAAGMVIFILIGMVAWLATQGAGSQGTTGGSNSVTSGGATPAGANTPPAAVAAANFCGTPIQAGTVIYVLDCGQSTKELFGYLREATFRSVESLGSDRKFQIIFWENSGTTAAYPGSGPAYATKGSIESARRQLDDIYPHGQTDALPAIRKAIGGNPGEIILATAKGWDLNPEFVNKVLDILGNTKPKFHTYALGTGTDAGSLKALADKTGGTYRTLTEGSLRNSDQ